MKIKISYCLTIFLSCLFTANAAGADENRFKLIMKDGQLRSHPVLVHVLETEITRNMNPALCLIKLSDKNIEKMKETGCPGTTHDPVEMATNQIYIDRTTDEPITKSATLLIFDLRKFQIHPLLTGSRVLPILEWKDPKDSKEYTAISENEVFLSNRTGTIIWTFFTLIIFFIIAYMLTKNDPERLLGFVTIKGGLSMSLTQMALWTIAVGGVVFGIGLMRLEVPEIPETLILLMGGAAGTAGVGHWQYYRWRRLKQATVPATTSGKMSDKLKTLLTVEVEGTIRPSLAKGQILFWTFITLIMFIVKSVLEGKLWDVPEQLVLLMGISQASFLARNELAVREEGKKAEKLETANELIKKAEDAANKAESAAKKVEETLVKAEQAAETKEESE